MCVEFAISLAVLEDLLSRRFCHACFIKQVEDVGYLKDKPKALHIFRVITKGHIYLLSAKSMALKKDWVRVSSDVA